MMPAAAPRSLTERQLAVMERIDRRVPIKVIAQDLGVSETRINQHIRALKDFYGAESLNELVENHRISQGRNPNDGVDLSDAGISIDPEPNRNSFLRGLMRADSGALGGTDAETESELEPAVVPRIFDGPNGTIMRLFAIVGLAIGIVGIFFLVALVSIKLGDALGETPAVSISTGQ